MKMEEVSSSESSILRYYTQNYHRSENHALKIIVKPGFRDS